MIGLQKRFKYVSIIITIIFLLSSVIPAEACSNINLATQSVFNVLTDPEKADLSVIRFYVSSILMAYNNDVSNIPADVNLKVEGSGAPLDLVFSKKKFLSLGRKDVQSSYFIPVKLEGKLYYAYVSIKDPLSLPFVKIATKEEFDKWGETNVYFSSDRDKSTEKSILHDAEIDIPLQIIHRHKNDLAKVADQEIDSVLHFLQELRASKEFLKEAKEFLKKDGVLTIVPSQSYFEVKVGEEEVNIPFLYFTAHASNNYINLPLGTPEKIAKMLIHELSAKCGNPHEINERLEEIYQAWLTAGNIKKVKAREPNVAELEAVVRNMRFVDLKSVKERDLRTELRAILKYIEKVIKNTKKPSRVLYQKVKERLKKKMESIASNLWDAYVQIAVFPDRDIYLDNYLRTFGGKDPRGAPQDAPVEGVSAKWVRKLKNISYLYKKVSVLLNGGRKEVLLRNEALEKLDRIITDELKEKEFAVVNIVGRSGSGKTTIANVINTGIDNVSSDEIMTLHSDQLRNNVHAINVFIKNRELLTRPLSELSLEEYQVLQEAAAGIRMILPSEKPSAGQAGAGHTFLNFYNRHRYQGFGFAATDITSARRLEENNLAHQGIGRINDEYGQGKEALEVAESIFKLASQYGVGKKTLYEKVKENKDITLWQIFQQKEQDAFIEKVTSDKPAIKPVKLFLVEGVYSYKGDRIFSKDAEKLADGCDVDRIIKIFIDISEGERKARIKQRSRPTIERELLEMELLDVVYAASLDIERETADIILDNNIRTNEHQELETRAGILIQFGIITETAKHLLFHEKLGEVSVPDIFVLPTQLFHGGRNYADIEFVMYYNFFLNQGKRVTVVGSRTQLENLKTYLERSLHGADRNSDKFKAYDDDVKEIIVSTADHYAVKGKDGQKLPIEAYLDFAEFDISDNARVIRKIDGKEVEIKISKHNLNTFSVTEQQNGTTDYKSITIDYRAPVTSLPPISEKKKEKLRKAQQQRFAITPLGTSHGFDLDGDFTSFIIWLDGTGIFVDPSPQALEYIDALGFDDDSMPYVYLTHTHADHDGGLLRKILKKSRVKLMATRPVYDSFVEKANVLVGRAFNVEDYLDYIEIKDGEDNAYELPIEGGKTAKIVTRSNLHSIPTSGFTISYRGKTFGYSGDTQFDPDVIKHFVREDKITFKQAKRLLYFFWKPTMDNFTRTVKKLNNRAKLTSSQVQVFLGEGDAFDKTKKIHEYRNSTIPEGVVEALIKVMPNTEKLKDVVQRNKAKNYISEYQAEKILGTMKVGKDGRIENAKVVVDKIREFEYKKLVTLDPETADILLNALWKPTADEIYHEAGIPPIHTSLDILDMFAPVIKERMHLVHIADKDVPSGRGLKKAIAFDVHTLIGSDEKYETRKELEAVAKSIHMIGKDGDLSEIQKLLAEAELETIEKGTTVISEGEQVDDNSKCYRIKRGKADVYIGSERVATLRKGEVFGHIALGEDNMRRTASVVASTDLVVQSVTREQFRKYILDDRVKMMIGQFIKYFNPMRAWTQGMVDAQASCEAPFDVMNEVVSKITLERYNDETIIREGEVGDKFYVIKSGKVKVKKKNNPDLAILKKGDYFGEMALMSASPKRTASVEAIGAVEVLVMDKETFKYMTEEIPWIAQSLASRMYQHVAQQLGQIIEGNEDIPPPIMDSEEPDHMALRKEEWGAIEEILSEKETSAGVPSTPYPDEETISTLGIELTELEGDLGDDKDQQDQEIATGLLEKQLREASHGYIQALLNYAWNLPRDEKLLIGLDDNLGGRLRGIDLGYVMRTIMEILEHEKCPPVLREKIVFIRGKGTELTKTVLEYTSKKGKDGIRVHPSNVIMVLEDMEAQRNICNREMKEATITFINDNEIVDETYYPFVEVVFYTIARALYAKGISGYTPERLNKIFEFIRADIDFGQVTDRIVALVLKPIKPYDFQNIPDLYRKAREFMIAA